MELWVVTAVPSSTLVSRQTAGKLHIGQNGGLRKKLSHLEVGRRPEAVFIWEKVAPPDRITLPAEARQLAHPSCLIPQDEFAILM